MEVDGRWEEYSTVGLLLQGSLCQGWVVNGMSFMDGRVVKEGSR